MLFTDSTISTVDDLADYETEIRSAASAEAINLETKLRLAQTEIGVELLASSAVPDAGSSRTAFTLDQVVVTDALRLWHIFHTLAIVFRDAYNRRLNDKYKPKWSEYQELAKTAAGQYLAIGVALVFDPLAAPVVPTLDSVAGGSLPATNYFVRITWVNGEGEESYPSSGTGQSVAAGRLLRITPPAEPESAAGWKVYAGTSAGGEQLQTQTVQNLGESWTMPSSGLVSGALPGDGQSPDVLRTLPRTLQRG